VNISCKTNLRQFGKKYDSIFGSALHFSIFIYLRESLISQFHTYLCRFAKPSFHMKKIIVLVAGLVGSAIAIDLKKEHDVTSADASAESLKKPAAAGVPTIQADLSDWVKLKELVQPYDLVIGALPGFLGYNVGYSSTTNLISSVRPTSVSK
jgi:hypothetical protein